MKAGYLVKKLLDVPSGYDIVLVQYNVSDEYEVQKPANHFSINTEKKQVKIWSCK